VEGKVRLFGENLKATQALAKNIAKSIGESSIDSRSVHWEACVLAHPLDLIRVEFSGIVWTPLDIANSKMS
jgi:hypothetical protein